jgi:hypothetical protein
LFRQNGAVSSHPKRLTLTVGRFLPQANLTDSGFLSCGLASLKNFLLIGFTIDLLMEGRNKMQETFVKMVREQFQFLIDKYQFEVIELNEHVQYDARAEGYIEFQSLTTFVTVTGEWYWNGVAFGRAKDNRKFAMASEQVYEYLSFTPEERAIVCSHDPKDNRTVASLIASRRLQHEKREYPTKVEEIHNQLVDHARWLQQYAHPFLKGDFSLWFEVYNYKIQRMIGEQKRAGRNEVALRLLGKDDNAKPI